MPHKASANISTCGHELKRGRSRGYAGVDDPPDGCGMRACERQDAHVHTQRARRHAALAVFLTHGMQPATAGICRRMDRCSVAIHASRN